MITGSDGVSFLFPQLFLSQHRLQGEREITKKTQTSVFESRRCLINKENELLKHTQAHTFIKHLGVILIAGNVCVCVWIWRGREITLRFPSLNLTIPLMLMADKTGENNMLCCLA